MTALGWVVVALAGWCAVAVVTAVVLGRVIRHRDRQIARVDRPVTGIPAQRCTGDQAYDRDSERGNPELQGGR